MCRGCLSTWRHYKGAREAAGNGAWHTQCSTPKQQWHLLHWCALTHTPAHYTTHAQYWGNFRDHWRSTHCLELLLPNIHHLYILLDLEGICCNMCTGRRTFGDFISNYTEPVVGRFEDVTTGQDVGPCANMLAVTLGQGSGISGLKSRLRSCS